MTRDEFAEVWRVLNQEFFVPKREIERWASAIGKCRKDDVDTLLEQRRQEKVYGIRRALVPDEVRCSCENYHGMDPFILEALEELR